MIENVVEPGSEDSTDILVENYGEGEEGRAPALAVRRRSNTGYSCRCQLPGVEGWGGKREKKGGGEELTTYWILHISKTRFILVSSGLLS